MPRKRARARAAAEAKRAADAQLGALLERVMDDEVEEAPAEPVKKDETMSTNPSKGWNEGIPHEQIAELAKSFVEVHVKLHRFNQKGLPGSIYGRALFATAELSQIDAWAGRQAGGGTYGVEIFDPENATNEVLQRFRFSVEGAAQRARPLDIEHGGDGQTDPTANGYDQQHDSRVIGGQTAHTFAQLGAAAAQNGMGGMPPSYGQPQRPGYPGNYAQQRAQQQGFQAQQPPTNLGPGATVAADQVLIAQLAEMRAALAQQGAALEQARKQAEVAEKQRTEREHTLQRQLEAEKHRAELAASEARMEARFAELTRANRPAEKSGLDVVELMGLVVPLIQTWMQTSATTAAENARLQMQMALGNKPGDPFEQMAKLTPLLERMAGGKGKGGDHESMMALVSQVSDSQMAQAQMAANMVKTFAETNLPEEHPAMPVVKQLIESMQSVGVAYFNNKEQEAQREANEKRLAQQQARQLEQQTAARKQAELDATRPPTVVPMSAVPPAARPAAVAPVVAAPGTKLSVDPAMFAMLPPAFQTPEWRQLLTELHTENDDGTPAVPADEIAQYIAHYIEHLVIFKAVPPELIGVLAKPRETITQAFALMPVRARHPEYVERVVAYVSNVFEQYAAQRAAAAPAPAPAVSPAAVAPRATRERENIDPRDDDEESDADSGESDAHVDDEEEVVAYPT